MHLINYLDIANEMKKQEKAHDTDETTEYILTAQCNHLSFNKTSLGVSRAVGPGLAS